jgi:hypothetical protein
MKRSFNTQLNYLMQNELRTLLDAAEKRKVSLP